jgi:hypothetical protein
MAFRLLHLDEVTRSFMITEIERDLGQGSLYLLFRSRNKRYSVATRRTSSEAE